MFFLKKFKSADDALNRVQDNADLQFRKLNLTPFLDGVLLKAVAIGTADTLVNHGLGRPSVGYLTLKSSTAAILYDGATASKTPESSVTLRSSAAGIFNVWVF